MKASRQLWWPQCHIPMFVTFCKGCCCCPNTNLDQCKWHLPPPFFVAATAKETHTTPLSCQTWVHPKNQLLVDTTFFIKLMSLSISFLDAKMKTHLLPMFKRLCTISCFHTIFSIISYIIKGPFQGTCLYCKGKAPFTEPAEMRTFKNLKCVRWKFWEKTS